ncbi:MAG: hypothetical protein U9R41_06920 [Candidatus Marinimicrobia bacterium]|nr:hypothetical protein [Candidatus Neomarinimicrobiota bacterium]
MSNKRTILTILFFGGLWGIIEATLGYLVHFLPTGFPGMIMFPIAFYFMFTSYKSTGKQSTIFYTALVASMIKLSDLFIPLRSAMFAINPAVSILLESLIVFGFIKVYSENKIYVKSAIMSLGWILLFTFSQKFIFHPAEGLYLEPVIKIVSFLIVNTIVSGMIIGTFLKMKQNSKFQIIKYNFNKVGFVAPISLLLVAVFCEIGNSLIF